MIELFSYLNRFTVSFIRCLETILEYIWYIPLLGTYLGNIIFAMIIILFGVNLFRKWILGTYKDNHSDKVGDNHD